MTDLDIAFVNASYLDEETSRNFHRELDADLVEFDAPNGEIPDTVEFDGVVISGSSASVYWDEPWIDELVEWTARVAEHGVPILGICFGHQVLAEALGGTVGELGELELGYETVRHTAPSKLFEGIDEEFLVFTARSDAITTLPPGATVIAENDTGLQGFEKDGKFYGFQGHPEFDFEMANIVIDGYDLPEEVIAPIVETTTEENYERAKEAKTLFDNFLEVVRATKTAEASR